MVGEHQEWRWNGEHPTPHSATNWNYKTTDFVDAMISNVLRDLLFSRNKQVKSADD